VFESILVERQEIFWIFSVYSVTFLTLED
jgi:hypothetical protein